MTTTKAADKKHENALGRYLRDRRKKASLESSDRTGARRRTAGLRREEVAQRSGISTAWYISLEQGRGGAPSAKVLDCISRALRLNEIEREHLFLIGLGRSPETNAGKKPQIVPRLQSILDRLCPCPALIKSAVWDVLAWNEAWLSFVPEFPTYTYNQRNMLRFCFLNPRARTLFHDWEGFASYAVGVFRAESARAGALASDNALIRELLKRSPEFQFIWSANQLGATSGALKKLTHPTLGVLEFESSTLGIEGRQDLLLVVSIPTRNDDATRLNMEIAKARQSVA